MGSHIVGSRRFSPYGNILHLACGERAIGDADGPMYGDGPLCAKCAKAGAGVLMA